MSVCTNIFQQVFSLSIATCGAASASGDVATLQTALTSSLNGLLNNSDFANGDQWRLAWGPVVWQSLGSTVVDQAAAVSYNATANTYVVSIAATNPNSPFDIFLEDLAVTPNFLRAFANGGAISYGNDVALQALLGLQDPAHQGSLANFLASVPAGATLVFCGHSLGGGLAPILAMALYKDGAANSQWADIHVYPSAGPATGDAAFASAYKAAYPLVSVQAGTYQMWNANQFNTRDIVPNAWATGTNAPSLDQITAGISTLSNPMFVTGVKMEGVVVGLRTAAKGLVAAKGTSPYQPVNVNALFTGAHKNAPITSMDALAEEILYQHIDAYMEAFGVAALFGKSLVTTSIHPALLRLVHEQA